MSTEALDQAVARARSGADLERGQAADALSVIMAGEAGEDQIRELLLALREKGESADELAGMAQTMRSMASEVRPSRTDLLDTCGTGGGRQTFNVSTAAALVAAGAGCAVAKHGNRTATGLTGSADVLEELGASLDLDPEAEAQLIDEVGFGFMFAPAHHAATRHVVPVRKALGVSTIFNLLGPLTNPAGASRQLIGVWEPGRLDVVAGALARLGTAHALVVSSRDGIDEISISAPTEAREVRGGDVQELTITPEQLGLPEAAPEEIPGGDAPESARVIRGVLAGETGAARDIVLANAAAAIYLSGGAESIREGVARAGSSIDSGAASQVLGAYVERSRELAAP
jgi:anthranilate phosphoribosyltransferase